MLLAIYNCLIHAAVLMSQSVNRTAWDFYLIVMIVQLEFYFLIYVQHCFSIIPSICFLYVICMYGHINRYITSISTKCAAMHTMQLVYNLLSTKLVMPDVAIHKKYVIVNRTQLMLNMYVCLCYHSKKRTMFVLQYRNWLVTYKKYVSLS